MAWDRMASAPSCNHRSSSDRSGPRVSRTPRSSARATARTTVRRPFPWAPRTTSVRNCPCARRSGAVAATPRSSSGRITSSSAGSSDGSLNETPLNDDKRTSPRSASQIAAGTWKAHCMRGASPFTTCTNPWSRSTAMRSRTREMSLASRHQAVSRPSVGRCCGATGCALSMTNPKRGSSSMRPMPKSRVSARSSRFSASRSARNGKWPLRLVSHWRVVVSHREVAPSVVPAAAPSCSSSSRYSPRKGNCSITSSSDPRLRVRRSTTCRTAARK